MTDSTLIPLRILRRSGTLLKGSSTLHQRRHLILPAALALAMGCTARNYTHYLVEPAPNKLKALEEEEGTLQRPMSFGSTTTMKIRWNDGKTITEVELPMLASGQRIIVEHSAQAQGVTKIPATRLVPPVPTVADRSLEEAYRARGLSVKEDAPAVSISGSQSLMTEALREGNYQVALERCEMVLSRFPSHPGFLRAKGSILLLMGERPKAIEIYESAEEVESDPEVRATLERLLKEEDAAQTAPVEPAPAPAASGAAPPTQPKTPAKTPPPAPQGPANKEKR